MGWVWRCWYGGVVWRCKYGGVVYGGVGVEACVGMEGWVCGYGGVGVKV